MSNEELIKFAEAKWLYYDQGVVTRVLDIGRQLAYTDIITQLTGETAEQVEDRLTGKLGLAA